MFSPGLGLLAVSAMSNLLLIDLVLIGRNRRVTGRFYCNAAGPAAVPRDLHQSSPSHVS
jgi:hypothetical protein